MEDQVYETGRSLYEAPSTLFYLMKCGYNDLKSSVNESVLYKKLNTTEFNETTADISDPNLPDNFYHNKNALQSISKKVLIAAAWSAGAAILISTFDMYWNQHGIIPALEN